MPGQQGISQHYFHFYLVLASGFSVAPSNRTNFGPNGEIEEIRMPDRMARNFSEFVEIVRDLEKDSDAALAIA
jgi:hypothetical protein